MDLSVSLISGLVAGLALAAPLGAIGVLLIQEGVRRGLRRGLAAAAAVATVDLTYCIAAVAAGALLSAVVAGWMPWPQLIGGLALVAIGVRGLVRGGHARTGELDQIGPGHTSSTRRYALFLGLTAINPATLLYFTAILTGLGPVTASLGSAIAFICGVGIASFAWQALLVALGAALRHKTGPTFRYWTSAIGNGLVVTLGLVLVFRAL